MAVRRGQEAAVTALAAARDVPCVELGTIGSTNSMLIVEGVFEVHIEDLREAYTATLPALFG